MSSNPRIHELEPVRWQHRVPGQLPIDVSARILTNGDYVDSNRPAFLAVPGYGEGEWAARQTLSFLTQIGRRAIISLVDTHQTPASQQAAPD